MANRQEKVIVRLNPDMKDRFQKFASEMGITMSALGAYVIGQWVINQERADGRIEKSIFELL